MMNLSNLVERFASLGCKRIFVKELAPNDNSKNQVYLGGSFDVLNIFPIGEITADESGDWKRSRFKAKLEFYWIHPNGDLVHAPNGQLILYPKYPEVRFSGFLSGSTGAPNELMTERLAGRLLFLTNDEKGKVLGHVVHPENEIASEFRSLIGLEIQGVFKILPTRIRFDTNNSKAELLRVLSEIHAKGWIASRRLGKEGVSFTCESPNCGGYTLEAELGITPNGYAEPDFLGWEVKQYGVSNFSHVSKKPITLMTPEPNGGYYTSDGLEAFVRKFGYVDKRGRPNRMNFGGIHKADHLTASTQLKLVVDGFDRALGKITNVNGSIVLLSAQDEVAASWSFTSLLKHWNLKHARAVYVPSMVITHNGRYYHYGNRVLLGTGTDFTLFLAKLAAGEIYYDPGIKLENMDTTSTNKRRSQFRIKASGLEGLYRESEYVTLAPVGR